MSPILIDFSIELTSDNIENVVLQDLFLRSHLRAFIFPNRNLDLHGIRVSIYSF